MESYDAIVVGTGGVGSAALYHLAKSGLRVLGLDQFQQAHAKGSSHGQTRIIRQAYFEHPSYVPLLLRTYELWRELESITDNTLFEQVGLLEVGPPDGVLIHGVMESADKYDLPVDRLTLEQARQRFPFSIPDGMESVFEPTAGYLHVEKCVEAHLQAALAVGAVWKQDGVVDWLATDRGVEVRSSTASYFADRLIVCGGAWSPALLRDLGLDITIKEKHQYWFAAPPLANDMPVFFFETSEGEFYGLPQIGESGLKVAQHTRGRTHEEPFEIANACDADDLEQVKGFVTRYFGFDVGEVLRQQACMYSMSTDGHFLVDRHPQFSNVFFAGGMSGHGFKFTPVLGEILSQLATGESPSVDVGFLGLSR